MSPDAGKIDVGSERREVLRGAGIVGGFIVISRILGYLRDAILAYYFGAKGYMDVFVVALRIPNTFRMLFAEGSLTVAFVPVFTEKLKKGDHAETKAFADTIFTLLTMVLLGLTTLGVIFAPQVVWLFAGGFTQDPHKFELAVQCTRIVFPYIIFISLVACAMGILNSLRHFSSPAAAGMVLNLSIILGTIFLPYMTPWSRLTCACVAELIGGFFQVGLQIPFLRSRGFLPSFKLHLEDPGVRKVMKLMVPAIFGSGIYQVNLLLMTRFASQLGEGSNSYLYYADRVFQLPLALFAISFAQSALPTLSRLVSHGDRKGFAETYRFAMQSVLFIVLPATAGLISLQIPIVQVLFQSGNFTWEHTQQTASTLMYFSLGLTSVALVRVTVAAFNAHQNTSTPVRISAGSLILNMVLCYVLMHPMGHHGLALAVTLAATFNFVGLFVILAKKYGPLGSRGVFYAGVRIAALSLVMGLTVWILASQLAWEVGGRTWAKIFWLSALMAVGLLVYLGGAYLLKFPELRSLKVFAKKSDRL